MVKETPSIGRIAAMVVFTLSCFGILMFLWLAFGGPIPLKPKGYRFQVSFAEATQLAKEADVRISGVPVGRVKTIEPDKRTGRSTVVVELESRYVPLPSDARAILRQKTLLGETYVELTPGSRYLAGSITKLFVATVTLQLVEEGRLSFADAFAHSCNTAFVQSASRLSDDDLAQAARDFGFDTLVTVSGLGEDAVLAAVEEAMRVGVLQEQSAVAGDVRYRFVIDIASLNPAIGAITGLQGGEIILGIDFRPLTKQLYALGSTSRLYTLDTRTAVATQVGTAGAFTLNPIVVSASRRQEKAPYALFGLLLMIFLLVSGLLPIHVASFSAALLVLLAGALTMEEAYRLIEWRSVFLVGALLPLGLAIERTGGALLIAGTMTEIAGPLGVYAVLSALAVLSNLLGHTLDAAPAVVAGDVRALARAVLCHGRGRRSKARCGQQE